MRMQQIPGELHRPHCGAHAAADLARPVDLFLPASPVLTSGLRLQKDLRIVNARARLASGANPRPQLGRTTQARVAKHAPGVLAVTSQGVHCGVHGYRNVRASVG